MFACAKDGCCICSNVGDLLIMISRRPSLICSDHALHEMTFLTLPFPKGRACETVFPSEKSVTWASMASASRLHPEFARCRTGDSFALSASLCRITLALEGIPHL